ncbi:hypothetical protein [Mucispirillum schaedleri]|uniref:hypothetical protein n=1 Tax=Mucispirillum schaedleri TaxID=248039 RepID=UPI001F55E76F|nr:hypothetical protein [Mucispirillum schaedleri]
MIITVIVDYLKEHIIYVWLTFVSIFGALSGFHARAERDDRLKGYSFSHKFWACVSAMFISYFTFETVLWLMPDVPVKMAVAIGGLAAFSGTDMGMALSETLVDFIKNKLRSKT